MKLSTLRMAIVETRYTVIVKVGDIYDCIEINYTEPDRDVFSAALIKLLRYNDAKVKFVKVNSATGMLEVDCDAA